MAKKRPRPDMNALLGDAGAPPPPHSGRDSETPAASNPAKTRTGRRKATSKAASKQSTAAATASEERARQVLMLTPTQKAALHVKAAEAGFPGRLSDYVVSALGLDANRG